MFWLIVQEEEAAPAQTEEDLRQFDNLLPIPELPSKIPILGDVTRVIGLGDASRTMCLLGREVCPKFGPIFRFQILAHHYIIVSGAELAQQVLEDPAFGKITEKDNLFKELRIFR